MSKGLRGKSSLKKNATKKMAKPQFKPKDILEVQNAEEGMAYRWLNRNKLERGGGVNPSGWEVVNTLNATEEDKEAVKGFQNSAHSTDGTVVNGDLVLAKMPAEMAEARNEYYRNKQKQKEEIISTRNKLGNEGTVQFESRQGRNVESY
jgi:hypothetical protein